MDKVEREMFMEHFKQEKERLSYLDYYDTIDEAANEWLKRCDLDKEYYYAQIWQTRSSDGGKYAIIKGREWQTALNFGYKLVVDCDYPYDVKKGRRKKGDYRIVTDPDGVNDGTKCSRVYKKYRELGLL